MKHCPITYEIIDETETYSKAGLKLLAPQLHALTPLIYAADEQRREAITHAGKMSIQGVQPKLSARLKITEGCFEIVDQYGQYILKPQHIDYPALPENEALTMSLAAILGLEVPVHGLVYSKDNSLTYFVKRFDRHGHRDKYALEDFAQLAQMSRDTKYNSSMEKVAKILFTFCTFPKIEAIKLFKLTLFNYLIGNEDMHLKNFSLITRKQLVTLSPAYDLLNTTIVQKNSREEIALPLNGKKNHLTRKDFIQYFGQEVLQLNDKIIHEVLDEIEKAKPQWEELIRKSFLPVELQKKYLDLLNTRSNIVVARNP